MTPVWRQMATNRIESSKNKIRNKMKKKIIISYLYEFYVIYNYNIKCSCHMLTSMSGFSPSPLTSPSSTFHPDGISTEIIAGFLWGAFSTLFKETSLCIRSSKGGLGIPALRRDDISAMHTEVGNRWFQPHPLHQTHPNKKHTPPPHTHARRRSILLYARTDFYTQACFMHLHIKCIINAEYKTSLAFFASI